MTESNLQKRFLLAAPSQLPFLRLFRRNTGMGLYQPTNGPARHVRFGIKGQCDLYALIDGGMHIELELKSKNGRLSEEQKAWRDWCKSHCIPWLLLAAEFGETEIQTVERWLISVRNVIRK